jgi:hypothetical protein
MPMKDSPNPWLEQKKLHARALAAWPWTLTLALAAAGFALAAFCPWPVGIVPVLASAVLALVCWIERRRASYFAARASRVQSVLAPYLPALPELVSQLSMAASQLEDAAIQACDGFHGIGVRAREALGGESLELEKEIVRVVVALQFQDIVNQQMTHAIEILTKLEGDLGGCLEQTPPKPQSRSNCAANERSHSDPLYAAGESKRQLLFTSNGAVKNSQTDMKGDIEIFLPEVGP